MPAGTQARVLGLNAQRVYRLPPRYTGPAGVVDAYFTAVTTARRRRPRGALHPRRGTRRRRDRPPRKPSRTIARFYADGAFGFDDLLPRPGPFAVDAGTVAVDIDLRIDGAHSTVADVFELAGNQIAALTIRGARGEGDRGAQPFGRLGRLESGAVVASGPSFRLLPRLDEDNEFFWTSGADGRLRFLQCARSPPSSIRRPRCVRTVSRPMSPPSP